MDFLINQINKGGKQVQQLVTNVTGQGNTGHHHGSGGNISSHGSSSSSSAMSRKNSQINHQQHHHSSSSSSTDFNSGDYYSSTTVTPQTTAHHMSSSSSSSRQSMSHSASPFSNTANTTTSAVNHSNQNSSISPRDRTHSVMITKSHSIENIGGSGHTANSSSSASSGSGGGSVPVDMDQLSSGVTSSSSGNNSGSGSSGGSHQQAPWNSQKFLSPYTTDTRVTGYTIDHYPSQFIEPYNASTSLSSSSSSASASSMFPINSSSGSGGHGHRMTMMKNGTLSSSASFPDELALLDNLGLNIEQQLSYCESLIQTVGAHNFPPMLLSSLISLFGNSPSNKVQDQLIHMFGRVVPAKSSDLNLEYWSVMNIVYKNSDSYSMESLLNFCHLSQYFDPTIPQSAITTSSSPSSSNSNSSSNSSNVCTPITPTTATTATTAACTPTCNITTTASTTTTTSELIPVYDADVLNLSFGVCLRMCERYEEAQISYLWTLMLKILYRNGDLLKLNQHWDSVILLFNNTIARSLLANNRRNKIEFGSFIKCLLPHHTDFLTQQVKMNHEKTPNSSSAVYVELPNNLYMELCLVMSQVRPHLVAFGVDHIERSLLPYGEQLKKELNVELILALPRTLSHMVEHLLMAVRLHSREATTDSNHLHNATATTTDAVNETTEAEQQKEQRLLLSKRERVSQHNRLFQLVCRIECLLAGDSKHLQFLIETVENRTYIHDMKQKLLLLYEELFIHGTSDVRRHCVELLHQNGESLKATMLSKLF